MQIYRHILVPIDCSPVDDAIVAHVADIAEQNGSKVDLLHVVHSHTVDQDRALRERAEGTLASYREIYSNRGVENRVVIRSGEPEAEILAQIDAEAYDLVAMATHGHGFIGDLLFGSVSRTLKHRIDIPLLLLRSRHS